MNKNIIVSFATLATLAIASPILALESSAGVNIESTLQADTQGTLEITPVAIETETDITVALDIKSWDAAKQAQIKAQVKTALNSNPQLTYASVSEDSVSVNYLAPAKFLGIFSRNINLHVTSDANGRVKVKFPWYRFLVKTEFANIAMQMNEIFQNNQSDLEMIKKQDPAAAQGLLLVQMSNVLRAQYDLALQKKP